MTLRPRPSLTSSKRPLSAIFLGALPSSDHLPALPEPPESPSALSETGSGLPSPPATNSTGSGSNGDSNSNNAGSLRQRPVSLSTIMPLGNYDKSLTNSKTSLLLDEEEDDEDIGNGEDDTARLERRGSFKSPNDNVAALHRVKSLAQRNRMAIDKLSSFSRLNTPSPSHSSSRSSRSPRPPVTTSSSSSSSAASSSRISAHSSRISSHSHSHSAPHHQSRHNDSTLSGSETERESQHTSGSLSYSSSDATPPSMSASQASSSIRQRIISAPDSPAKALASYRSHSPHRRQASPGPSRTQRRGVSTMSAPDESGEYRDVTSAALAAVASSRGSPTATGSNGKRSRQPLPREFLVGDRRSLDGRPSAEPDPLHRPHRDSGGYTASRHNTSPRMPSLNANNDNNNNPVNVTTSQYSPRGSRSNRSSTVRELTRRHQTRWLSEDLSAQADDGPDHDIINSYGRRQTRRGGSTDSSLGALNGGRSLVGQGLRAAGITMKNTPGDDPFGNANGNGSDTSATMLRRAKTSAARTSLPGRVEWDDRAADTRSRTAGSSSSRTSEGGCAPQLGRPMTRLSDPRTPGVQGRENRTNGSSFAPRPATSMAELYHGEDGSVPRNSGLRAKRASYTAMERDRTGSQQQSSQSQHVTFTPPPLPDHKRGLSLSRRSMTPHGNGSMSSLGGAQQNSQHTRLMLESLSMFESQLNRLPVSDATAAKTLPELYRHAETIVHASDKLNHLLKAGTNRALEEQIDAEVGDETGDGQNQDVDMVEMWRRIGGEYRESLRASDEIVRTLTGFLLEVGKVLREATSTAADSGQQHFRSASLGDDATRRSPDVTTTSSRRSQDGRRSADSRRSWGPLTNNSGADGSKRFSGRVDGINAARPPSSRDKERDVNLNDDLDPPLRNVPLSAGRRFFSPREQSNMTSDTPSDARDPGNGYEPSPTPASRQPTTYFAERHRIPPASSMPPPPLPSLPSESLHRGHTTVPEPINRRKASTTSISTVRAASSAFLPVTSTSPTTAITHHTVSNSPEETTRPLRYDSASIRSSVTFSRPSEVSLSALSGVQQQHIRRDEARRRLGSSTYPDDDPIPSSSTQLRSPLSGSETERDTRRRTIGMRRARMSYDGAFDGEDNGGSQAQTITLPSQRRERRPTVTEIFA